MKNIYQDYRPAHNKDNMYIRKYGSKFITTNVSATIIEYMVELQRSQRCQKATKSNKYVAIGIKTMAFPANSNLDFHLLSCKQKYFFLISSYRKYLYS